MDLRLDSFQRGVRFPYCLDDYGGAKNGSATFTNKKQTEDLCINLSHSYYYAYIVEWSGEGKYDLIPTYSPDHDNELIYTGEFTKKNPN